MIVPLDTYLMQVNRRPVGGYLSSDRESVLGAVLFLLGETSGSYICDPNDFCSLIDSAVLSNRVGVFLDATGIPISFYVLADDFLNKASMQEITCIDLGACSRGSLFETAAHLFDHIDAGSVRLTGRHGQRKKRVYGCDKLSDRLVTVAEEQSLKRSRTHVYSSNPITEHFFAGLGSAVQALRFIASHEAGYTIDLVKMFSVISYCVSTGQYMASYSTDRSINGLLLWGFVPADLESLTLQKVWWKVPPSVFSFGSHIAPIARYGSVEYVSVLEAEFERDAPIDANVLKERVGLLGATRTPTKQVLSI